MQTIRSHSSGNSSFLKQFIIPSPIQVLLYLLSAFVILAAINSLAIWHYLNDDPAGQQRAVSIFVDSSGSQSGSGLLSSIGQGRLLQIFLWTLIGVVIYSVIWFIKNLLNSVRNDIVADEYVHPKSYNRVGYWKSILLRKAFFILCVSVLLGFIYAMVQILPLLSTIFYQSIQNFRLADIPGVLLCSLALAILMYILIVIIRITSNSWRFIYADL
jgi:hypothetical protein